MRCEEAQELITARVDNEIDGDSRIAIDEHLRSCSDCSRAFAQESLLKRRVQMTARQVSAPAALRRAIEQRNAAPAPTPSESLWRRIVPNKPRPSMGADEIANASEPPRLSRTESKPRRRMLLSEASFPLWRRAFAALLIVVIAVSVYYTERREERDDSIALAAADTHASILSGKTTLLRAVNLPAMRKELAHAVNNRFTPVVLDLSMMKLYPVAGFVQTIAGRDLLVTVYQGDGPAITCFTFLGSEADAPKFAERFFDAEMGVNYFSFTRDDLNGVLHQEGDVICLLISKLAPAELLALLRGKTAHA
jgi:anti-sigma factor RsiW